MAIRINTNVESVFAQKSLARTQRSLRHDMQQLSSGLRITKAADDAAGLGVSEKMRAQISSLHMASRNAQDGISMIQTAEGAANEIGDILSRMRELAVESSSEVLQATERAYLETEFDALQAEAERIAQATSFNGLNLTDGTDTSVAVQVGIFNVAAEDRVSVSLASITTTTLGVNSSTASVSTASNAQTAIGLVDTALDSLNSARASYGANQNQLASAVRALENYTENLVEAESRIRDVDFADATASLTRNQIFQQAGIAILSQANSAPGAALSLLA
ncbi:MAG: flagellin [Myxococcota bacterium]|nr:flagellin [Myxococcota bacterium]